LQVVKVRPSASMVAAHVSTMFVSFLVGLVASGTFWAGMYVDLVVPRPDIDLLRQKSVLLFALSFGMTVGFINAKIKLRGRFWMNYTTLAFFIGGFLAAFAGIILIAVAAWADYIAATGG